MLRASSFLTPGRRSASLPLSNPFRMSRNVPASLPSRKATSGSISSPEASALAFFAIRCDSTASWFEYSISRRLPPPWPTCCAASCASSRIALFPWLMFSRPFASVVRLCWLSMTRPALTSTRSHRVRMSPRSFTTASSDGVSSETPFTVPPVCSASRSALNRSRLSLSPAKAAAWPCDASAVPRARRCESICISVAVDSAAAPCDANRTSRNSISAPSTMNVTISRPSTWNWRTTDRWPITGSRLGIRISEVAERSCSMIDTEASGS